MAEMILEIKMATFVDFIVNWLNNNFWMSLLLISLLIITIVLLTNLLKFSTICHCYIYLNLFGEGHSNMLANNCFFIKKLMTKGKWKKEFNPYILKQLNVLNKREKEKNKLYDKMTDEQKHQVKCAIQSSKQKLANYILDAKQKIFLENKIKNKDLKFLLTGEKITTNSKKIQRIIRID